MVLFFFFQAEDGIRDYKVTGVQTCALPILALGLAHPDSRHARRVGLPATGRTLRAPKVDRSGQTAAAVLRATLRSRRRGARLEVPARELARPRRRRAHRSAWIAGACDERVLERAHLRASATRRWRSDRAPHVADLADVLSADVLPRQLHVGRRDESYVVTHLVGSRAMARRRRTTVARPRGRRGGVVRRHAAAHGRRARPGRPGGRR